MFLGQLCPGAPALHAQVLDRRVVGIVAARDGLHRILALDPVGEGSAERLCIDDRVPLIGVVGDEVADAMEGRPVRHEERAAGAAAARLDVEVKARTSGLAAAIEEQVDVRLVGWAAAPEARVAIEPRQRHRIFALDGDGAVEAFRLRDQVTTQRHQVLTRGVPGLPVGVGPGDVVVVAQVFQKAKGRSVQHGAGTDEIVLCCIMAGSSLGNADDRRSAQFEVTTRSPARERSGPG